MIKFLRSGKEVINLSIRVLAKAMICISAADGVAACSIVFEYASKTCSDDYLNSLNMSRGSSFFCRSGLNELWCKLLPPAIEAPTELNCDI